MNVTVFGIFQSTACVIFGLFDFNVLIEFLVDKVIVLYITVTWISQTLLIATGNHYPPHVQDQDYCICTCTHSCKSTSSSLYLYTHSPVHVHLYCTCNWYNTHAFVHPPVRLVNFVVRDIRRHIYTCVQYVQLHVPLHSTLDTSYWTKFAIDLLY